MADTFTVTRGKAGVEDIYFGTGTYERTSEDGSTLLTIKKVNTDSIPVPDELGIFTNDYLSGVLNELYDLITEAHVQTWYYQDSNGEIIHGMGDVINQPADITAEETWYKKDGNGTVIHGMGDVLDKFDE